jgi:hypothetical protein
MKVESLVPNGQSMIKGLEVVNTWISTFSGCSRDSSRGRLSRSRNVRKLMLEGIAISTTSTTFCLSLVLSVVDVHSSTHKFSSSQTAQNAFPALRYYLFWGVDLNHGATCWKISLDRAVNFSCFANLWFMVHPQIRVCICLKTHLSLRRPNLERLPKQGGSHSRTHAQMIHVVPI